MSTVQSILISKKTMNKQQAIKYVKKLGYTPIKKVHETANSFRFRILPASHFEKFRTVKMTDQVTAVFGY